MPGYAEKYRPLRASSTPNSSIRNDAKAREEEGSPGGATALPQEPRGNIPIDDSAELEVSDGPEQASLSRLAGKKKTKRQATSTKLNQAKWRQKSQQEGQEENEEVIAGEIESSVEPQPNVPGSFGDIVDTGIQIGADDGIVTVEPVEECVEVSNGFKVTEGARSSFQMQHMNAVPRQRLTSDEHWRKDRPTKASPASTPKTKVSPNFRRDFYTQAGSPKINAWVRRKSTPGKRPHTTPKKEKDPFIVGSVRVDGAKETEVAEADFDSEEVKQEVDTARDRSINAGVLTPDDNVQQDLSRNRVENVKAPFNADATLMQESGIEAAEESKIVVEPEIQNREVEVTPEKSVSKNKKNSAKKDKEAKNLSPNLISIRRRIRPQKLNVQDRKETDTAQPGLGKSKLETRMAAWLEQTPDPFVENIEDLNADAFRPYSDSDGEEMIEKAEAPIEERSRVSRKQRSFQQQPFQTSEDEVEIHSAPSTPTLRRSGARRDPHRQKSQTQDENLEESLGSKDQQLDGNYGATSPTLGTRHAGVDRLSKTAEKRQSRTTKSRPITAKPVPGNQQDTVDLTTSVEEPDPPDFDLTRRSKESQFFDKDNLEPRVSKKRKTRHKKTALHDDLISALSVVEPESKSIVPARSKKVRSTYDTLADVMEDVKEDEVQYLEDLRKLVNGVIPVLLNSILAKSGSQNNGSVIHSLKKNPKYKDIIIEIGVVSDRVQSMHKRMPRGDPYEFLAWAERAQDIYSEYVAAWRLGFNNVVINLAAIEDAKKNSIEVLNGSTDEANNRIPKLDDERCDVPFLLKRPLVRLKYLSRAIKAIDRVISSKQAATLTKKYEELVNQARKRQDQEFIRVEDETAAQVDATRARDPSTLAALISTKVDPRKGVKARDVFEMKLKHSNGQRLNSRVMLIYRDDFDNTADDDLLVCQVDSSSRWLLFSPLSATQISARQGSSKEKIILMIRGLCSDGREWREFLFLTASQESIVKEWLEILPSKPIPTEPKKEDHSMRRFDETRSKILNERERAPSPSEIDVPIGEPSLLSITPQDSTAQSDVSRSKPESSRLDSSRQFLNVITEIQEPSIADHGDSASGIRDSASSYHSSRSGHTTPKARSLNLSSGAEQESLRGGGRTKEARQRSSRPRSESPYTSPLLKSSERLDASSFDDLSRSPELRSRNRYRHKAQRKSSYDYDDYTEDLSRNTDDFKRSSLPPRLSSIPSGEVPTIHKFRSSVSPDSRLLIPNQTLAPGVESGVPPGDGNSKSRKTNSVDRWLDTQLPQTSTTLSSSTDLQSRKPNLSPTGSATNIRRRSSSPLKREYAPSSDSDTVSAKGDVYSDDESSITSESSVDDVVPELSFPMSPTPRRSSRNFSGAVLEKAIDPQTNDETKAADDSKDQPSHTIASIYCWSDKGRWDLLHPDECTVVVSPGLIEAFTMNVPSEMNVDELKSSSKSHKGKSEQPLVAFELTPLVPLRQGTAIDISIRSPPTTNSKIRSSNNVMFRSRTGDECDVLYNLINRARINNPKYIALQNARGPVGKSNWGSYMDKQASLRGSGGSSWWRLGSKQGSYRAGKTRRTASVAETISSVGTRASAMSALKRFTGGSQIFDVAKSTIGSRAQASKSRSSTSFTGSSRSSSNPLPPIELSQGSLAGITQKKVRFYERESASKWRDMGSARLTVMHPSQGAANSQQILPSGHIIQEKRVLVTGKTRGETLLDVTLDETAFERVARTGVAVKVFEQREKMGKTGGVTMGNVKVFMIQLKSEAEAAHMFSFVGRLRY